MKGNISEVVHAWHSIETTPTSYGSPIRNEQFNLTIGFRNSIAYWKQLLLANILAFEDRTKLRAFKFEIALSKALKIEYRRWKLFWRYDFVIIVLSF